MKSDQFKTQLRSAADMIVSVDEVPLATIHSRVRRMRRHRSWSVIAVAAAVLVVVIGGIAFARRPPTTDLRVGAPSGDSTHAASSGPSSDTAAPSQSLVPGSGLADPNDAPDAAHYYKATARLTFGDRASASPQQRLDAATAIVRGDPFIDAVATQRSLSPELVRSSVGVWLGPDGHALDLVAIGTDAAATVDLADVAAQVLIRQSRFSEVNADLHRNATGGAIEINRPGFAQRMAHNIGQERN